MKAPAALPQVTLPRVQAYAHQYFSEHGVRMLLSALFAVLLCYTGTLVGAFSAQPHVVAETVTAALLLFCCLLRPRRKGRKTRLIVLLWRNCERLPGGLLAPLAAWLFFDAVATGQSTIHCLSREVFGFHLWSVLIGALIYATAVRGYEYVEHFASAIIVALDLALGDGSCQYFAYWANPQRDSSFHAQHFAVVSFLNDPNQFGQYLAMLFPIALWDAGRAALTQPNGAASIGLATGGAGSMTVKGWSLWRLLRPAVIMGISVAVSSRSNWLAVVCGAVVFFVLLLQTNTSNLRSTDVSLRARVSALFEPYRRSAWVGLALAIAVGVRQSSWMQQRFISTVAPSDLGNIGRGVIWRNGLRLALHRPFFGWGPGTFAVNYPQTLKPYQFREVVLQAHNVYLQRLVEEGLFSLVFWAALVFFVMRLGIAHVVEAPLAATRLDRPRAGTAAAQSRDEELTLLVALIAGTFAYLVCGIFVMPEQFPTMSVHFLGFLALITAICWREKLHAVLRHKPGEGRWVARGLGICGALLFVFNIQRTRNAVQAHELFDEAMASNSLPERTWRLREARDLDPDQPLYWAQLGLARYLLEGPGSARSVAYLFRGATHRARYDSVWYHDAAIMYLQAGNPDAAIASEKMAVKYDPTYSFYQATLADAEMLAGHPGDAALYRERARQCALPPIVYKPLADTPELADQAYFCQEIRVRYHRVVRDCQVLRLPHYSIDNALHGSYPPFAPSGTPQDSGSIRGTPGDTQAAAK